MQVKFLYRMEGTTAKIVNDIVSLLPNIILEFGALRVLTFASEQNFEKELHGQYAIHRRKIPRA